MINKDQLQREKMLNGGYYPIIIAICLPLFTYNLFNAFYNLIDTSVVSAINPLSVSAVAAINQIQNLISSLGTGMAAGGAILVARYFGANDIDKASKYANTLMMMAFVLMALLLGICIPFGVPILKLTGVPLELIDIGTQYFYVQIISLSFMIFNGVFIALQKAKGDTKSIFILNILVMIIKLVLTLFFVYVKRVDNIIYVAFATLCGQLALFIIALTKQMSKNNIFVLSFKGKKMDQKIVLAILKISFPIFLGKFIFSFGKVSVNAMCKDFGPLVVGALGVSDNICGIVTSPINSFEETESTLISVNLGNRNLKRAFKMFTKSAFLAVLISTIGYILVRFVYLDELIALFTQNSNSGDSEVFKELIKVIFNYASLSIIALGINAAVMGVLYGFGKTKISMLLNISRVFVFRIPLLYYFKEFHYEMGIKAVGLSMGLSNIGIAVVSLLVLIVFLYNIKQHGYHDGDNYMTL